MSIRRDLVIKVSNGTATLDMPLQIYEKDHGIELRFKLMDYKYKYDKDPENILNSNKEDILEAYTTIVNPSGYELAQINGEVVDDTIKFMIEDSYTDELEELGTYQLQIHVKCTHSEFSIPPVRFEVLERLKGEKVVTDGDDEVDYSDIIDGSTKFVDDETGKLIIQWQKGDTISSVRLNAMVEVINNAVDEEAQRQLNEVEREQQELEREQQELERENRLQAALDSVDARVDESMDEYETRFNALTASQQQDAEVIDARDGEVSLKARLDRDVKNPLQVYEDVEGSYISYDSTDGYAQNVEILGNTIQDADNLADIRSVGDDVEGQELYEIPVLSCGKNLFDISQNLELGSIDSTNGTISMSDRSNNLNKNTNGFSVKVVSQYGGVVSDFIKIKPNTTYTFSGTQNGNFAEQSNLCYFDKNKNFITGGWSEKAWRKSFTTPSNACYLKIGWWLYAPNTISYSDIQLEVGTVATPYEPYQSDKLTILSPVQLEKVGDVADRIVCKDGVWGVEKNVGTVTLDGSERWERYYNLETYVNCYSAAIPGVYTPVVMSNKFKYGADAWDNVSEDCISGHSDGNIYIVKTDISSASDFIQWLQANNTLVKYATINPIFIPLPHDQQVKLRTFANKTNIHFGCEIEGTIKASVPKSIGATVNSHSEQIGNLSKELDRVKKLEESTVSTVVTESDFTTVEETSNGYFEDVKLEGKTLVNLFNIEEDCYPNVVGKVEDIKNNIAISRDDWGSVFSVSDKSINVTTSITWRGLNIKGYNLTPNTKYSIIFNLESDTTICHYYNTIVYDTPKGPNVLTRTTDSDGVFILTLKTKDIASATFTISNLIIIEGDHTQNPPSYFEGLKSVGQEVEQISVESAFINTIDNLNKHEIDSNGEVINGDHFRMVSTEFIPVNSHTLTLNINSKFNLYNAIVFLYDANKKFISKVIFSHNVNKSEECLCVPSNCKYYKVRLMREDDLTLNTTDVSIQLVLKRDKKPLLYYNNETQTWEKPILRQWDSIEKHSDGKYYYHKRSGEVVLNGSENWVFNSAAVHTTVNRYLISSFSKARVLSRLLCNKFAVLDTTNINVEGILIGGDSSIYCNISKSKLVTQDVEGFKAWLQANPTTLVYQLAQEKVYECTDLDLITYADETNLVMRSGVLSPKTTLKVHSNIGNVVTLIQNKTLKLEESTISTKTTHDRRITDIETELESHDRKIATIETKLETPAIQVEGSYISCDSTDGYAQNVEILGVTIQDADNLADIRSVGDKLEGQELYEIPVLSTNGNLWNDDTAYLGNHSYNSNKGTLTRTDKHTWDMLCNVNDGTVSIANKINIVANKTIYIKLKSNLITQTLRFINSDGTSDLLYEMDLTGNISLSITPSKDYCGIQIGNRYGSRELNTIKDIYVGYEDVNYVPYQEHKLTILSSVQLEKVGDVADRIICKDGVWGVEKNIEKYYNKNIADTSFAKWSSFDDSGLDGYYINNIPYKYISSNSILCNTHILVKDASKTRGVSLRNPSDGSYRIYISFNKSEGIDTIDKFKEYAKCMNMYLLATQPQFIPLPHDQQVKLRTFANKTNIHFECEIEPTIKASVPKSLGATVNSHSEQIDNLSKELDRVKKLEESTVSTVVGDTDFISVAETTNGYFSDIKLEGRTLVVNADNEVVEVGTEGATLKSVGEDVDEISVLSTNTHKYYTNYSIESDTIKQDKKRILYYNEETQAWEKPILRQWDSIEKHSDGKYYYHKRSGEVVLDGSEAVSFHATSNKTCSFTVIISDIYANPNNGDVIDVVCDKFVSTSRNNNFSVDVEGISNGYLSSIDNTKNGLFIRIDKSKLSTQDVAGFKAWLQANNVTVVYQLAQEKVYECTNLDLITYADETNFIVNTGAITPLSTLKVLCNINNVVRELQQKVSNLENYIQHVMIDALNNALNE